MTSKNPFSSLTDWNLQHKIGFLALLARILSVLGMTINCLIFKFTLKLATIRSWTYRTTKRNILDNRNSSNRRASSSPFAERLGWDRRRWFRWRVGLNRDLKIRTEESELSQIGVLLQRKQWESKWASQEVCFAHDVAAMANYSTTIG